MKRTLLTAALVAVSVMASGCTFFRDTDNAQREAQWVDKPASITCHHFGTVIYDGRSKGKVNYEDGGRLSFVDAKTSGLVNVEGECIVRYDR